MLIQKIFHLQMPREIARQRLGHLAAYPGSLRARHRVEEEDGVTCLRFHLPLGFDGCVELAATPGGNALQSLFASRAGNIRLTGVAEYFQLHRSLTEVVLTLDYRIIPLWFRFLDAMFGLIDGFLTRELRRLEQEFNRAPAAIRADRNLAEPINGHAHPGEEPDRGMARG
jgi:hypothetical protein